MDIKCLDVGWQDKRVPMASWVALRETHMDLKKILLFLFLAGMFSDSVGMRRPERAKESEAHFNNSVIKTIKTDDGDIFDCFEINKQPSLSHPLLKNHTIEMRPSSLPIYINDTVPSNDLVFIKFEGCPTGTVPIQRVITNGSIKETRSMHFWNANIKTRKRTYYGASAEINVWGLPKIPKSQYSAHEVWIINGYFFESNQISAGWMVNPSIFGDYESRLFTWWTVDGSINTGCFNTRCPGFVHVNKNYPLGSRIRPLSTYNGRQTFIKVYIFKARDTGNWWFLCNDQPVGYWPRDLFKRMDYGQYVHFGGVASCPWYVRSGPMASGHLPSEGLGKACFMKDVQIVDDKYVCRTLSVNEQASVVDSRSCFDVGEYKYINNEWRYSFYFGGPGGCL